MTREEAIEVIEKINYYAKGKEREALDMAVNALVYSFKNGMMAGILSVAPILPRKGEWVDDEPNINDWSYKKGNMPRHCSACGHRAGKYKYKTYKFCPWCGADMRGADHD